MKLMANSIPKGGTHLIIRLLNLLGYADSPFWIGADLVRGRGEYYKRILRGTNTSDALLIGSEVPVKIGKKWLSVKLDRLDDSTVFGAHCLYTKELEVLLLEHDIKIVCIIRDPRSIAMSHLHYIKKSKNHFFYNEYMSLPTDNDRLRLTILGGQLGNYSLMSLKKRYQDYMKWSISNNTIMIRFEDLVGSKGDGNDEKQAMCIEKVAKFVDADLDETMRYYIRKKLFGGSSTFRKGETKGWKSELDSETIKLLSNELTDELIALGYEADSAWVDSLYENPDNLT